MCWESDGYWISLGSGVRVARKQHLCEEGHHIEPGERYHWAVGIYDGDFYTGKSCEPHLAAAKALGAACRLYEPHSDDPPVGKLRESYYEHLVAGELPLDVVPADVVDALWRHAETVHLYREDEVIG